MPPSVSPMIFRFVLGLAALNGHASRASGVIQVRRPTVIAFFAASTGKKSLVKYGLATTDDLLQTAREYFGVTVK